LLRDKDPGDSEGTTVFDYAGVFVKALQHSQLNRGSVPDPRVFILIGTEKKLSNLGEVPIYATVMTKRAENDWCTATAMAQVISAFS
jgi:hypothetical protein